MKTTRDDKAKPTNDGSCISLRNPTQLFAGDISQCNECRCFSQQESHNQKPPEHCCAAEPCQTTLGSEVLERERERERGGGVKTLGPHCHAISSSHLATYWFKCDSLDCLVDMYQESDWLVQFHRRIQTGARGTRAPPREKKGDIDLLLRACT